MLTEKFLQDLQFEAEDIPYILKNDRLYGEEIEKLAFYSQVKDECVALIDEKLLEFWR